MASTPSATSRGRALAWGLAGLFLALSLLGYDPADPPGSGGLPRNQPAANPCGPVGATLAHLAFQTLGWGALVPLLTLGSLAILAAGREALGGPGRSLAGLLLLIVFSSTFVQSVAPGLRPAAPIGAGGELGALGVTVLGDHVGRVGTALVLAVLGGFGIRWAADDLVRRPVRVLLRGYRAATSRPSGGVPAAHGFAGRALTAAEPIGRPGHALPTPEGVRPEARGSLGAPELLQEPAYRALPAVRGNQAPATAPRGTAVAAGGDYLLPPLDLLEAPAAVPVQENEAKVHERAALLEKTLLEHGCHVRVVAIETGPVITQFEIELEPGLRVSRIISLSNDLAIALAVPSVRIVAPLPNRTTVGIEVPNERRSVVRLGEVIDGTGPKVLASKIPLFLGKDVQGNAMAFDLAEMPHLLIAGRTGTGKSVCLNAMILSILMTRRPDEVKLILIDPKMVELSQFKRIPHLMHPVVTDMKKAESLLAWACEKMDERYGFLARAGVRNIQAYNQLGAEELYERIRPEDEEERARIPTYMPYIVIIADEMADLMMTAAKEVESHIVRLAQKARAVGMHLIVATQKPTVDVITGLIKGNLPARIAFQVASKGDSRVVLDEMGADKLLGNGDMLFLVPGTSHILRAQGTYVADAEVHRVCGFLERYPVEYSRELMQVHVGGPGKDRGASLKERDDLYEPAIEVIIREGRGSCSLLQRALGIGYGRAARLIDFMAEDGIVGEFKSGSAREVLYTWEEWEALRNPGEVGATSP